MDGCETVTQAEAAELVDDQERLQRVASELASARLVALDTEFVRERTYYPKLCLIQVATERAAACVDFLAGLDLEPLYRHLFGSECTWLVHSARQDLEVIWQATGRLPARLIDTQIAAGLVGYPAQIGLEVLLEQELGRTLGASYARMDWSRRPLPPAAIQYAREDVAFLLAAWRGLASKLIERGRLAWAEEDSARLLADPPVPDLRVLWQRLKGVQHLPAAAQRAAFALLEWREAAARRADRPRRWIMADELLVAIAAASPGTSAELLAVPEATPRLASRYGRDILAAVARRDDPDVQDAVPTVAKSERPDRERLKRMQEAVRRRAAELGIQPEIVATRRDMMALASGASPDQVFRGWRAVELANLPV